MSEPGAQLHKFVAGYWTERILIFCGAGDRHHHCGDLHGREVHTLCVRGKILNS